MRQHKKHVPACSLSATNPFYTTAVMSGLLQASEVGPAVSMVTLADSRDYHSEWQNRSTPVCTSYFWKLSINNSRCWNPQVEVYVHQLQV